MKRLTFLFILTTLLLESCSQVTAIPPATETATPTAIPSRTPPPTSTAIPTATPHPPLHTQGPYLLYTRDYKSLTIMDADGSGRRQIQLPGDGYTVWEFRNAVSPNGKWIAYLTGSVDEPYDLTLNILNLKDETSLSITRLIAPGFPQNLEPVTKTAVFTEYDTDCSNDLKCQLRITESAFKWGIKSLSWSPDSQFLVFAAQIDGPSSDLYIYDVTTQSIRRLTNELENISSIEWAPNGKKILYTTSQPGTIYVMDNIRVADPQSNSIQNPKKIDGGLFWSSEGWITDDSFLIWSGGEGGPPQDFRYINVENQQVKVIWKYEAEINSFFHELHGMVFALSQEEIDYAQIPLEQGTYFVNIKGKITKLSTELYIPSQSQESFTDSFLAYKDGSIFDININESDILLINENVELELSPHISPDKKWVFVQGKENLQLFSEDFQLIKSWDFRNAGIFWRSDTLGAFVWATKGLYYIPIPDGEPIWLSDCKDKDCPDFNDGVWLP